MRRSAIGIALIAVVTLPACQSAEPRTVERAPEALSTAIDQRAQPVSGILVSPDKIVLNLTAQSTGTGVTVWPADVADTPREPAPAVPASQFPLDEALALARDLADGCDETWQFNSQAVSAGTALDVATCGDTSTARLAGDELPAVEDPFSESGLTTLWDEITRLGATAAATQMLIGNGSFAVDFAPGTTDSCPLYWSRGLTDPGDSYVACQPSENSGGSDFAVDDIDPAELADAIDSAIAQLPRTAEGEPSALVFSDSSTIQVSVTKGANQTTVPIGG